MKRRYFIDNLMILLFTLLGLAVMGYHPGAEDDAIYLSALKADLNPGLYPRGAEFFKLQLRTSVIDNWMADFVHLTGMTVAYAELLWQLIAIFLILLASWQLLGELFKENAARWAGLALLTAMFTLPVAGSALYLVDPYLHPRTITTALLLFAITGIVRGRRLLSVLLIAIAFIFHPLMGALGISFCFFLFLTQVDFGGWFRKRSGKRVLTGAVTPCVILIPFGWILDPPSPIWLKALHTRYWFRLYEWAWYEWLGAVVPLLLFLILWWVSRSRGEEKLARFSLAVFAYGVFQLAFAMIVLGPESLICFSALEPMRFLHLIYLFMVLIGGALLGRFVLKSHAWRWVVYLLLINVSMFLVQRQVFPGSVHIEWPGSEPQGSWLRAFDWIRLNTPTDAYFAMNPRYMEADGEDFHGFRALAERSQMADMVKDTSVVTKFPELGPEWEKETRALDGWNSFRLAEFERLKGDFKVDWVLVDSAQTAGLDCRWHDEKLAVCRVPYSQ